MSNASSFLFQRLEADQENWQLRRLTAEALANEESTGQAAALLADTPVVPPSEEDLFFSIDLIASVDIGQASSFANQVLAADGGNPLSYVGKALASWLGGDPAKAQVWYLQAQEMQPGFRSKTFEKLTASDAPTNEGTNNPVIAAPARDPRLVQVEAPTDREEMIPLSVAVAVPAVTAPPAPPSVDAVAADRSVPAASVTAAPPAAPVAVDVRDLEAAGENAHLADLVARASRRKDTKEKTAALTLALLIHIGILALLTLVIVAPALLPTPEIVAVAAPSSSESQLETRQIVPTVKPTPAAPSRAAAQVINAIGPSATAISTVNFEPETEVIDLGSDFGAGFGMGSSGVGIGGGAGFFGQAATGRRFAYVIDYSLSMRGPRDALMREELAKSVKMLRPGISYQLIFFAGPAWVAGDDLKVKGRTEATVKSDGRNYDWVSPGGAHAWTQQGRKQIPKWLPMTRPNSLRSLEDIEKTKLEWGTIWGPPLEMALSMEPPPDVIFFMTDGSISGPNDGLDDVIKLAKRTRTKINTIAMMEPRAEDGMKKLAERTGGEFSMVNRDGSVTK